MGGHVIQHAISRAGLSPEQVEEVVMGCGGPEGATGSNVGATPRCGPGARSTTSGTTLNRFCSSG
jgi:acetyl-CoA C-acetyltransferase